MSNILVRRRNRPLARGDEAGYAYHFLDGSNPILQARHFLSVAHTTIPGGRPGRGWDAVKGSDHD
jgi:hypothetical protein